MAVSPMSSGPGLPVVVSRHYTGGRYWALYGEWRWPGWPNDPQLVAFFTDKKRAELYIEDSRLVRPTELQVFKKRSLLFPYMRAFVAYQYSTDITMNPTPPRR